MLPTSRSSLSSFRDYYQQSSQNQAQENDASDIITIGFHNFQVNKILQKIDNRIQQKIYWITFVSFKKISMYNTNQSNQVIATQKLKKIVMKQTICNPKIMLKNHFLSQLLWNVKFQRQRQVQTMMKLCIWLSKKYKQNISQAYYAISKAETKHEQQSQKQNTRYVKKLSKAMLCIIFRNLLHKKIKQHFQAIKNSKLNQMSKSNIRFFKPKKGRQVYEHKVDQKIKKLNNFIYFFKIINKKINRRAQFFVEKLKVSYKIQRSNSQGDSLEIMTNTVRHLVYLTAKQHISLEKQNQVVLKINALKFQSLAKRVQRKSNRRLRQCLYHWRDVASQNNRHLGQQIKRLLLLKQKILEDI